MGRLLLEGMIQIAGRSDLIANVRGRGMFVAFDLPSPRTRDLFRGLLWENGLIALKSGQQSVRFRPMLDLSPAAVEEALGIVEDTLYDARSDGGQL
jgi:L-lysine 6-transaminase